MGTKTQTIQFDDLDDSQEAAETVVFRGPDGREYSIDLNDAHAKQLNEVLDKYEEDLADFIGVARLVEPVPAKAPRKSGGMRVSRTVPSKAKGWRPNADQNAAVREWAKSQGLPVNERGRLSVAIVEAYNTAHAPAPAPVVVAATSGRRKG